MREVCKFKVGDIVVAGSNTPYIVMAVVYGPQRNAKFTGWNINVRTIDVNLYAYDGYPQEMFRLAVPEQIKELVLKGLLDDI